MAKKFFSIFLAFVLVLGMLPVIGASATDAAPTFPDMPDNWATKALESAVANGILTGYDDGKLWPNNPLTRAQMATIITRAFGATENADISAYSDVKSTDWFAGSIAKAVKMGVMQGYDGKMSPNDNITREQAFVVLARALKLDTATEANKSFSDSGDVSDWAKGHIFAMVNAGYIQGSDGKLNPKANITRAEFAQVIYNVIKQYIKAAGEYTTVADGNVMVSVPGVTLKNVTINGDLIVGDGVGDGNLTLENVAVKGRLVARGGGVNSIIIKGGSVEGKVVVAKVDGKIRVSVEGGADVEVIVVDDGKDDVVIEGTIGTVQVNAPDVPVAIQNATVSKVEVNCEGAAKVTVSQDAKVTNVVVGDKAGGSAINVAGQVSKIETSAPETTVSGTGSVGTVTAKSGADGTTVTTPNTVVANQGATGVTAGGGQEVPQNGSTTNNSSGSGVVTPPSGGGGGDSGYVEPPKEITGFTPLADVILDSDENLVNLTVLKASGKLPTKVTVTDGTTPAEATITNWTGTFDGTTIDTYTLTAVWTMPSGYVDNVDPISVTIDVIVDTVQTKTVSSITIKTAPGNVSYVEGQKLDLTGLEVTLNYNDGSTDDVALADFGANAITTNPADGATLTTTDTKVTITHTVSGESVEQAITVVAKEVTGIAVNTQPTKLSYVEGQTLNLEGLVVTLTYNDTTTEDVAAEDFASMGITATPAAGTPLTVAAHNNQPVVVSCNSQTADTTAITVVPAAVISSVNPTTLTEAAANDGSLTDGTIVITIANGTLATDIAKTDVTAANLPTGLDFTVTRDSDTQLTITITGNATNHINANDVTNLTFTIAQGKVTGALADLTTGNITIDFNDQIVTELSLDLLVTAPEKGATPVTTAIDKTQYSGTIEWFESDGTTPVAGNFAASTVYIAKVTLTAKEGYTFTGIGANSFTYTGATSVANADDSGVVIITFPATEPVVLDSTITQDPGKTGGDATVTVEGKTITFGGTIAYYEKNSTAVNFPPVSGNYVGVKVTAPTEITPGEASTLTIGETTYTGWNNFGDGDNYFFYYPRVTAAGQTFTFTVKWDGTDATADTFTIKIAADATLQD